MWPQSQAYPQSRYAPLWLRCQYAGIPWGVCKSHILDGNAITLTWDWPEMWGGVQDSARLLSVGQESKKISSILSYCLVYHSCTLLIFATIQIWFRARARVAPRDLHPIFRDKWSTNQGDLGYTTSNARQLYGKKLKHQTVVHAIMCLQVRMKRANSCRRSFFCHEINFSEDQLDWAGANLVHLRC